MENESAPATSQPLPEIRDLPRWIWLVLPLASLLLLIPLTCLWPENMGFIYQGDIDGGGVVENGTFVILLPGIAAGLATFLLARRRRVLSWERYWFLGWTLACLYFAGEEISWGQHYFHWSTPEIFQSANDQQETNLHNISSWLDQKPRALVEAGILIGGLLLPIWLFLRKKTLDPALWSYWLWPTCVCAPSAAAELTTRLFEAIEKRSPSDAAHLLGSAELREFYIAFFLSVYLLSAWFRLRSRSAPAPAVA